jgi:hypothetical protein
MKTMLLAAAAALSLSASAAFAESEGGPNGYAIPDFWGKPAAQQSPIATGPVTHSYLAGSNRGTWLFPPNPNGGGGNN